MREFIVALWFLLLPIHCVPTKLLSIQYIKLFHKSSHKTTLYQENTTPMTSVKPSLIYNDVECYIKQERYAENNKICLELVVMETNTTYLTATANVRGAHLEPNEVSIKNYSENTGVYEALLEAGIIGPCKRTLPSGYVEMLVCDLLIDIESPSSRSTDVRG